MEIKFYNRVTGKEDTEKVYGDKFIQWLYESNSGKTLSTLICKAPLSKFYGALQDFPLSQKKVAPFIKKFHIHMDDYLPQEGRSEKSPYANFNQFFIRRFRPGKRPIVKGHCLKPKALLANTKWEKTFEDGPLLLARLCPVDYHRYHYPDDGKIVDNYRVHGLFHSVNPLALKSKEDILITNERHVTILDTVHFGKLAYIEVGAICVGKIIQSKPLDKGRVFARGDEKGYFLFGGSTVIVIGEKGKWKPSSDILENTKKAMETYLHLGTTVASIG